MALFAAFVAYPRNYSQPDLERWQFKSPGLMRGFFSFNGYFLFTVGAMNFLSLCHNKNVVFGQQFFFMLGQGAVFVSYQEFYFLFATADKSFHYQLIRYFTHWSSFNFVSILSNSSSGLNLLPLFLGEPPMESDPPQQSLQLWLMPSSIFKYA